MTASPHRRPNILLITLDQFRADCLGSAGHPLVRTPNLDRLAADGVRFTNHFSNCAPCAPGRASLLTGLWQMNHRVTNNGAPLADHLPMLPRLLRELGYDPTLFGYSDTALDPATLEADDPRRTSYEEPMPGFSTGVLLDDDIGPWIDWLAAHGYDVPEQPRDIYRPAQVEIPADRGATWPPAIYSAEHSESAFLTATAIDWLRSPERSGSPWCAHLSYLRPHPPYLAPAPYHDMFDPADVADPIRHATAADEAAAHPLLAAALAIVPAPESDLDQRQLVATYYGMIAEVDHQVGVLLDELDRSGQREDTVVVLTSDHGEQLGDHWLVEKLGFFDQSFRIPLIIRWPAVIRDPGRVVEEFTENVDIVPTLLDLCGGGPPEFCDGASLRPFLDGRFAPPLTPDSNSAASNSAASNTADSALLLGPRPWRGAVHYEWDFRDPNSTLVEQIFSIRQDQCAISVLRDAHGKYVHFAGGLPALFFDLDEDPGELHDLLRGISGSAVGGPGPDAALTARVLDYTRRLLDLRLEHTDPRLANTRATAFGTVHRSDPPRP